MFSSRRQPVSAHLGRILKDSWKSHQSCIWSLFAASPLNLSWSLNYFDWRSRDPGMYWKFGQPGPVSADKSVLNTHYFA